MTRETYDATLILVSSSEISPSTYKEIHRECKEKITQNVHTDYGGSRTRGERKKIRNQVKVKVKDACILLEKL